MSEPGPMPSDRPLLRVRDVVERDRYEATLGDDDALAALLTYRLSDEWIALLHTEVQEGFEGQGVGGRFVRAVLDDVRARGLAVIPKCPFVVGWLQRHPEYHDILLRPLDPTPDATPLQPS